MDLGYDYGDYSTSLDEPLELNKTLAGSRTTLAGSRTTLAGSRTTLAPIFPDMAPQTKVRRPEQQQKGASLFCCHLY
jgi:hypothetical protein